MGDCISSAEFVFSEENESCSAGYLELIYSVLEIDWVRGP